MRQNLLLLWLVLSPLIATGANERTLFRNINLFTGENEKLIENSSVLVEGNLITAVGSDLEAGADVIVIDGEGRTLMPGLIDSHVHMGVYMPFNTVGRADINEFMSGSMSVARGHAMLMRGFTTIRDTGGPSIHLRDVFDHGYVPGPRVYGAEAMITQTGGHGDMRGRTDKNPFYVGGVRHWYEEHFGILADGRAEWLKAGRENYRNGADFFKIHLSGGVSSQFDPLHAAQMLPEELEAILDVARNAQTYVTAHCHTIACANVAVDSGVHMLEHTAMMLGTEREREAVIRKIVKKGMPVELNTAVVLADGQEEAYKAILPPEQVEKLMLAINSYRSALELLAKHKARIVYGTDLVSPYGQKSLDTEARLQHAEWAVLKKYFDHLTVLKAATLHGGEVAAMTGPNNPYPKGLLGVIRKGAYADILLVAGDPLEDPEILADHANNINLIMKDGVIYKNEL